MAHDPLRLVPPDVAYSFGTAGELATTAVPVFAHDTTIREVRAHLRLERYDLAHELVVCRNDRFEAVVGVEELLVADDDDLIGRLTAEEVPRVTPDADPEVTAWALVRTGAETLVVIDDDDRFLGLVPADRVVQVMVREHEADLARLSGFQHDAAGARLASTEPIHLRLWHRLPWLLIGLAGAVLAAIIVGGFEEALAEDVELAFFLPGIVYLADAVGTQTETLVVRGLSVGVGIRDVVAQEILTGLALGILLGAVAFPVGVLLFDNPSVAIVVSISLFAASSIATAVAMLLPFLFHRLGVDPAYGSGPIATVVQDLLSIVIYFVFASALL